MVHGPCGVVTLAMTPLGATSHQGSQSYQERHCEGNGKCKEGDIKPEAIQQRKFPIGAATTPAD